MFVLSLVACLMGFGVGVYLTYRFVPTLAATREGSIVSWIVRGLTGAALSWMALQVYFGIYAFVNYNGEPGGLPRPVPNGGRTAILAETLESIFLLSGLLIAAATVVHLLGPMEDSSRKSHE